MKMMSDCWCIPEVLEVLRIRLVRQVLEARLDPADPEEEKTKKHRESRMVLVQGRNTSKSRRMLSK